MRAPTSTAALAACVLALAGLPGARAESGGGTAGMTLHVVPQSHIDIAWWWRYDPETIHVSVKKTLELAFTNLEKFPDYTFSFLQVPAIAPMERHYPELFYKLHYYMFHTRPLNYSIPNPHETTPDGPDEKSGRFKIVSGLWLESDGGVPSGESMVRQCLYGKRYFNYNFGIDVKTAWFHDSWTHPWTYPQILKKCGIDSYLFHRTSDGENQERMFWWESPDGSRVFAYKPAWFNGFPSKERLESEMRIVKDRYGVTDHIALIGVGDHGGGTPEGDIETMRKTMASLPARAKFSTAQDFLASVFAQKKARFPIVKTEISGVDRGAYTTAGDIKTYNRKSENLLATVEKFSSIASRLDRKFEYPRADLAASWEKVMLNQTHDTISGTDILPATDDGIRLYQEVLHAGAKNLDRALRAIAERINTGGRGAPLVVFNPLSWERSDVVEADVELPDALMFADVLDSQGRQVPVQAAGREKRNGKAYLKILFIAKGVPSLGYKTYRVVAAAAAGRADGGLKTRQTGIENEFFKVEIDPATGLVKSILDRKQGRQVLDGSGRGNLIQIIEDAGNSEGHLKSPDGKLDWLHRWTGKTWDVVSDPKIKLLEAGPVRGTIEIKKKHGLARFSQKVRLYPGIPRIDFDLTIDWEGKNKMVKVSFPANVSAADATYEIPYGTISRPSNGVEQPAQKWVDVSERDHGVSLINDGRYGYDVKGNAIRLSVLRSPTEPVYATDERGVRDVRYALYPHQGGWREADVMRRAYEINNPLLAVTAGVHGGELPPEQSFLSIEPKNVIAEVLKKAEDSDDLILRFYETDGRKSTVRVTLAQPVDAVHEANLLEKSLRDVATDGTGFEVPVGGYAIETFKLIRDGQ